MVASLFVSSRVVGPLRQMVSASRRLAEGHYAERVPVAGDDELGELATSFNELAAFVFGRDFPQLWIYLSIYSLCN